MAALPAGLHLTMHRTIGLIGYIGPLTLVCPLAQKTNPLTDSLI